MNQNDQADTTRFKTGDSVSFNAEGEKLAKEGNANLSAVWNNPKGVHVFKVLDVITTGKPAPNHQIITIEVPTSDSKKPRRAKVGSRFLMVKSPAD